jgi:hypothetical protein
MAISITRALCVKVIYRLDEELKEFKGRIIPFPLMERFFQLEAGHTDGLFIPVGKGQQISAKNIEWFEIIRVTDGCECPDQYEDYLT